MSVGWTICTLHAKGCAVAVGGALRTNEASPFLQGQDLQTDTPLSPLQRSRGTVLPTNGTVPTAQQCNPLQQPAATLAPLEMLRRDHRTRCLSSTQTSHTGTIAIQVT